MKLPFCGLGFLSSLKLRISMDPEKFMSRFHILVLGLGLAYILYILFYSCLSMMPITWNERQAKSLEKEYARDEKLRAVRDYTLSLPPSNYDVTVVTAYFNLGNLNKGGGYTPELYKKWMTVFGRINNPLIVFTDSKDVFEHFTKLRSEFPPDMTKVIQVNRTSLWSFSLAPQIKKIFRQPGYPRFDPNTLNENYSCVMHAKFELIHKVITEKMYKTRYISWLDIGLFRKVVHEKNIFPIRLPPNFNKKKVAYSGQRTFKSDYTPFEIVMLNTEWVGGAMFLGRADVVYVYTEDYMKAVEHLIIRKVMSTDQQVVYIMYLPSFPLKPRVELQLYSTNSIDDWFFLGYIIKDSWEEQFRAVEPTVKFLLPLL